MIADLKPYPAYKNSGVPSLGEIPRIGRLSVSAMLSTCL